MALIQKIRWNFWMFGSLCFLWACSSNVSYYEADVQLLKPHHEIWDSLLTAHVKNGQVDYQGMQQDSLKLNEYLESLNKFPPGENDADSVKMAFWINAYNAFTVKLIVDHYPISSITELHPTPYIPLVNTVWHTEKFLVGDEEVTLNHIEHGILREEFDEPRIHFAINCASFSCPELRSTSYKAEELEFQLHDQALRFLTDSTKNELTSTHWQLSSIFSWFKSDFTENGEVEDYLLQVDTSAVKPDKVRFKPYNWSLNDLKEEN